MVGNGFFYVKLSDQSGLHDLRISWQKGVLGTLNLRGAEMKTLLIACALAMIATPFYAGPIERACNKSDRKAVTAAKCSCIQKVAKGRLSHRDQRLAATFFAEPQLAQDTRQADSPTTERFWKRYKAWGLTAAKYCRK
jgi:hypothetical protein